MSILAFAVAAALLAVQTPVPQTPAPQTPAPQDAQTAAQAPTASAANAQLTPAQLRSHNRTQAQQICSRRAPTGRRLEQATCVSREMAAAQSRAGQDEHNRVTLENGWSKESGN
ncbi:MAG TPA: hypothetical protein VF633_02495 [Brevundimonas sp.]|jgi:hypothetical protein